MRGALILLVLLAGCASTPPQVITIEKPVNVPGPTVYLPVPVGMFDGCVSPPPQGPTNGDLLTHDHAVTVFAACLQGQLTAIKGLK